MTIEENTTIPEKNQIKLHPGYVYVIEDQDRALCKIGRSSNPKDRIQNIVSQGCINVGRQYISPKLKNMCHEEKNLHRIFSNYNVHGEWFSADYDRIIHEAKFFDIASEADVSEYQKEVERRAENFKNGMTKALGYEEPKYRSLTYEEYINIAPYLFWANWLLPEVNEPYKNGNPIIVHSPSVGSLFCAVVFWNEDGEFFEDIITSEVYEYEIAYWMPLFLPKDKIYGIDKNDLNIEITVKKI